MKAILNEIKYLSKIFLKIYEALTTSSLIIYLIICIIPIIFLTNRKLTKSDDILDSNKLERHISNEKNNKKKNIQEPPKEMKDKKENERKSKILSKIINFCICKKKKQKDLNQLQLGRLLKEEGGFQIIEENKEEQILSKKSENNKISSQKESNDVKNNIKNNLIQDNNNILQTIETDNQNNENNKKEMINHEEKEDKKKVKKIENYINENKNEDDINKQINEKEIKKTQEGKDLKLIKEDSQNNLENKKINNPKENELNESINKYIKSSQFQEINLKNQKFQIQNQATLEFQKQNLISQNIDKDLNKNIDKKNNIEEGKNDINEKMIYKYEIKFNNIEIKLQNQMLMIKSMDSDINEKINSEKLIQMKNQIASNIYKMSYIFRFLNNIRLILISRKYINQIIKYEVDNNKKLKISKSLFLNDIAGFKYKDDEKKIKLYITKFIVQIEDHILSQNQYNLTIDFLFFLKKFFNDSVHFVRIIKDITINEKFNSIFSSKNKNNHVKDNKNNRNNNNKIIFNNGTNNNINITNIQCENKDSDKIIENMNEIINNNKILRQNEVLNTLDTEISNDIKETHDKENKSQYLQKKLNNYNNLKLNKINSIAIINNELVLDKNIYIIKDKPKQFYESNIQITRKEILNIRNIYHSLEKIIKIKEEIKNIVETIISDSLESQLTLKLEKNNDLFDIDNIDNININLNKNMNYSIHDLKNNSINNLKNIFINYFIEEEEKKSYYNSDNLLKNEKENINSEFSNIMNEIILAENMINYFQEKNKFIYRSDNTEDLQNIVLSINSIKDNINYIKGLVKKMNNKIIKYYDILLLSIAFKIKVKQLHEKFLKDKNALTFEELLKDWKNEFLDEYIKKLKKKYLIDENIMNISTKYKGKIINIEYLKTAKEYKKYIKDSELSQINAELMLSNIDTLIQNRRIDIYGTDEDIDFSKLPFLSEV